MPHRHTASVIVNRPLCIRQPAAHRKSSDVQRDARILVFARHTGPAKT